MTSVLVAVAAAGAVVALLRPPPRVERVATLVPPAVTAPPRPAVVLAGIGRPIRRVLRLPPGTRTDRLVGGAAVVLASAAVVGPTVPVSVVVAVALARRWRRLRRAPSRPVGRTVADDLPDLIDLLALTIGAGITVPAALPVVARWAPAALRPAVAGAADALAAGVPLVDAVTAMASSWGDDARPLARAVADHARNGTPLLPVLDRLATDARARRRRAAETRARRLPVLLLFPLVLCTLPAFALLTVAPIVAGTFRSLEGERLEASASTTLPTEDHPCTPLSSPSTWRPCPSPTGRATP